MFKFGDRVVVSDDEDDKYGEFGIIVEYDGSDEGEWPWGVKFDDHELDYNFYNADELELANGATEPGRHLVIEEVDGHPDKGPYSAAVYLNYSDALEAAQSLAEECGKFVVYKAVAHAEQPVTVETVEYK